MHSRHNIVINDNYYLNTNFIIYNFITTNIVINFIITIIVILITKISIIQTITRSGVMIILISDIIITMAHIGFK